MIPIDNAATLEEVIQVLEETLDGEQLKRAKTFAALLFEYQDEALEKFIEEEMGGKISEAGRWIFIRGFQEGTSAYEDALEDTSPELRQIGQEVDELFEQVIDSKETSGGDE